MAAPISLADFKFNLIGRQPQLLKRFQDPSSSEILTQPSPSPSPPPPVVFRNMDQRSRPSLLQSLGQPEASESDAQQAAETDNADPVSLNIRTAQSEPPKPIPDNDLDSAQCPPTLQYPPTPAERLSSQSPPVQNLPALHTRLISTIASIRPPNTSTALRLARTAEAKSAEALTLAQRSYGLAQDCQRLAREASDAAQAALKAGEEAQASVQTAITSIDDLGFTDVGSNTQEWKQAFQTLNADLAHLSTWIIQKEADEVLRKRDKELFEAEKLSFEKQVLDHKLKAEELRIQQDAVVAATAKRKREEDERLEKEDEIQREAKRLRAAERERRNDIIKRKAEQEREEAEREQEERVRQERLKIQMKKREEILLMKQKAQQQEAAKILAHRNGTMSSSSVHPPVNQESNEVANTNLNGNDTASPNKRAQQQLIAPAVVSDIPPQSQRQDTSTIPNVGEVDPLTDVVRAVALGLRGLPTSTVSSTSRPSATSSLPPPTVPTAICLSPNKGNIPLVDTDSIPPHILSINLQQVLRRNVSPAEAPSNQSLPLQKSRGATAATSQTGALPSSAHRVGPPQPVDMSALPRPPPAGFVRAANTQLKPNGLSAPISQSTVTQTDSSKVRPAPTSMTPVQQRSVPAASPSTVPSRSAAGPNAATTPAGKPPVPSSFAVPKIQPATRPGATSGSVALSRPPAAKSATPVSRTQVTQPPSPAMKAKPPTPRQAVEASKPPQTTTPPSKLLPARQEPGKPAPVLYRQTSPISPAMTGDGGWDTPYPDHEPVFSPPVNQKQRRKKTKEPRPPPPAPSSYDDRSHRPRSPIRRSPTPPPPLRGTKRPREEQYFYPPPAQRPRDYPEDYHQVSRYPSPPPATRSLRLPSPPPLRQARPYHHHSPPPASTHHPYGDHKLIDRLGDGEQYFEGNHPKPKSRATPLYDRLQNDSALLARLR